MRVLFYGLVTPIAIALRPLWRARLGLAARERDRTYWRRRNDTVDGRSLRSQR